MMYGRALTFLARTIIRHNEIDRFRYARQRATLDLKELLRRFPSDWAEQSIIFG
jgi:hypothetical protein